MEDTYITSVDVTDDYHRLLDSISILWRQSKEDAIMSVNTKMLEANWETGRYIVEFEQKGKKRAEYGKQLLSTLAKDLTIRNGKGFNRSNLTYCGSYTLHFQNVGHCPTN